MNSGSPNRARINNGSSSHARVSSAQNPNQRTRSRLQTSATAGVGLNNLRPTTGKGHSASTFLSSYAYADRGPSERTVGTPIKGAKPRISIDSTNANQFEDTTEPTLAEEHYIFQRVRAERRAQLPELGVSPEQSATWNIDPDRTGVVYPIELDWKQIGEKPDEKLFLVSNSNKPKPSHLNAIKQVIWKHCRDDTLSLVNFEALVQDEFKIYTEQDAKLASRVLAQIKHGERELLYDGRFLEPDAARYDSRDPSGKTANKCATFLNFPYLTVQDSRSVGVNRNLKDHHPKRQQTISTLTPANFAKCVKTRVRVENTDTRHLSIFAPQLWCMVIGEGALITNGYLQFSDLKGQNIIIEKEHHPTKLMQVEDNALLRISFQDEKLKVNNLVFPLVQCDCFFGLLNKHRQILELLLGSKFSRADAVKYPLFLRKGEEEKRFITSDVWFNVLRGRNEGEEIHVQMIRDEAAQTHQENARLLMPALLRKVLLPLLEWPVVDEYEQEEKMKRDIRARQFLDHIVSNLPTLLNESNVAQLHRRSITSIQWSEKEDPKETSSYVGKSYDAVRAIIEQNRKEGAQTDQDSLCENLVNATKQLLELFLSAKDTKNSEAASYVWGCLFLLITDPKAERLSARDFDYLDKQISSFFHLAEALHVGVYRQHARFTNRNTLDLNDQLSDGAVLLNATVQAFEHILRLFLEIATIILEMPNEGSQSASPEKTLNDQPRTESEDPDGRSTELAEESTKEMTEEAPEKGNLEESPQNCIFPVQSLEDRTRKIRELLIYAKEELIAESDRSVHKSGLNPSATPEGILISLLDRLSGGVYKDTDVNIIQVYNESLQELAIKVRDKPNRRLLRPINEIIEEIDIIREIYEQQAKVLSRFHDIINWESYGGGHTAARRLNFPYESKAIQKILKSVKSNIKDFKELRQRTVQLSDQNVQFLETVQDDNNKVLYVFTLVTILFLPASFVASYFGMNVSNINGTDYTTHHFWIVAGPLTVAVVIMSLVVTFLHDTLASLIYKFWQWISRQLAWIWSI